MFESTAKTKFGRLIYPVLLVVILSALFLSACGGQTGQSVQPTAGTLPSGSAVSFSKDILPMFQNSCVKCHGGENTNKGLDVTTYDKLMAGSANGAVIVPSNADGSKLVQQVVNGKMPKRGEKLTSDQIQMLKDWVNAGAKNN
jgi:hypothetical protein